MKFQIMSLIFCSFLVVSCIWNKQEVKVPNIDESELIEINTWEVDSKDIQEEDVWNNDLNSEWVERWGWSGFPLSQSWTRL